MGMGTSTTQTIVTAERLGLPLERVTVAHGDSSFPGSMLAGGSGQTASIIGAVIAAQRALVEQLLALAGDDSPLAGLTADEVGGRDEGLCELADPSRWESYSKILERAGRDELTVVASAADPDETQTYSMHSTGAVFCEVRVNTVTGETRVDRLLGSYDCGRIINPKTAASQFRGGIIMGIGLALMEDTEFDERTARIMNPSLAEYHVPGPHGRAEDRGDVDRHPRSVRPGGRSRNRRDWDYRRRRRGRQRDLQRNRSARAGPADHPRQAAVRSVAIGAPRRQWTLKRRHSTCTQRWS